MSVFLPSASSLDYQLIDSGNYRKLERFGKLVVDRPEISASWEKKQSENRWEKADWVFFEESGQSGKWQSKNNAPSSWEIAYQYKNTRLQLLLKITKFKHLGIFPEQAVNWEFISEQIHRIPGEKKVLNLFSYTGIAGIVAAKSDAKVTNVDSVRQVLDWGKNSACKNGINSIRWIQEDAKTYVQRAIRRKELYQGIIMDPPAFGHGTKNKKWVLKKDLPQLLKLSMQLLDPEHHFFILNSYSPQFNSENLNRLLSQIDAFPKNFQNHDLFVESVSGKTLYSGNLIRFWH